MKGAIQEAPKSRGRPLGAKLTTEERVAHVWELRLKGFSHEAIANELLTRFGSEVLPVGWNAKMVYDDCVTALNRVQTEYKESAIEMVNIELQRFDALLSAVWDKALEGDPRAVEAALSISKERRKMVGLDTPEKFQLDWRIQLVGLLQNGTITPQQIATEFGPEALEQVNYMMLEARE